MSADSTNPGPTSLQIAIDRYFEIALYLLVAMGFVTLATTGELDVP